MKLLLDTCIWGGTRKELRSAGHDVIWAGEWPEDPGDDEILERSHREGRVLVTLDKDFGELAIVHGITHSGIIRLVNLASRQQASVCLRVIELHGDELESGAIITAELNKLRIRSPDIQEDD
jgi:predicted nuclease of predicted toxin-antitoxin system